MKRRDIHWSDEAPVEMARAGQRLIIEDQQPFVLHFGVDGWTNVVDRRSSPLGVGRHEVRQARAEFHSVLPR